MGTFSTSWSSQKWTSRDHTRIWCMNQTGTSHQEISNWFWGPIPQFQGPPVKGLKEHKDGLIYLTVGCNYACHKPKVMAEHWTLYHPNSFIPKDKRAWSRVVRCFFPVIGTKYFAVNPSIANIDPQGLYATLINDYLSSIPPLPMLPPNTHWELPPLLAYTGWNLHLDSFVTDDTKCKALLTLALCPLDAKKDPLYGQLHDWVFEYMDNIQNIAQFQVPYTILGCNIMV